MWLTRSRRPAATWSLLLALLGHPVLCGGESAGAEAQGRRRRSSPDVAAGASRGDVGNRTIDAALGALPRRPARILVVDDEALPAHARERLRDLDAFVPVGSSVIYLRRQSRTLRDAEFYGGASVLMLAIVIWHEMAHAEGLDEAQAQRREEQLWEEFVQSGRVESSLGLTYLAELKRRR